jgi:hypothetical protein
MTTSILALLWTFALWSPQAFGKEEAPNQNPFVQTIELQDETVSEKTRVSVAVDLPSEHDFTEGIALKYEAKLKAGGSEKKIKKGSLRKPARALPIRFDLQGKAAPAAVLKVDLNVPYCTTTEPKMCKFKTVHLIQPLHFSTSAQSKLDLQVRIEQ